MVFLTTLLFSVFITIGLIPILSRLALKINLIDVPDGRKVHATPMPRSGGIAIAIGALVPILFWTYKENFLMWYIISIVIIGISGLIDDLRGHGPWTKFLAQIIAALVIIFPGDLRIENLGMLLPDGLLLPAWISIPLTLITIVGVTNAINLSDGLDGLAGGICLLSFSCLAYIAYLSGNHFVAIFSVAIAGAIFGFLRFNTYPASIFMGDTGSQFLGFSLIVLSLKLTQSETPLTPLLPLIILGFPILDTITVMAQRYQEGRPLFRADMNHFHHRLIRLGFFQTESVFIIYLIQAGLVIAAFLFRFHSEWFILIGYLIFSGFILTVFTIADKKGFRLQRVSIVDKLIKGRLKELRDRGIIIKVSFRIIEFGIPLLLIFSSFIPKHIPNYASYTALILVGILVLFLSIFKKYLGFVLRIILYIYIPYLIYIGNSASSSLIPENLLKYYNISFFLFAIFIVLTIKFSRRRHGFKSTPMDFLILFIALIVPNLPIEEIESYHIGLIAAKIITLFFSYEVLMGELRENFRKLASFTILSLVIFGVRGMGY